MFGQVPAPGMAGGIPNAPSVPPAAINQPSMPQVAGGDLLGTIFSSLFNPDMMAEQMARSGVSPADFTDTLKGNKLSEIMTSQGKMSQRQDGVVSNIFGGQPLIDRGLYKLPGAGAAAGAPPSQLGEVMAQGQGQDLRNEAAMVFGERAQPVTQTGNVVPPITAPSIPPITQDSLQIAGRYPSQQPISPPVVPGREVDMPLPPVEPGVGGFTPSAKPVQPTITTPSVMPNGNKEIFDEFMGAISAGGVTNPNALAAIAATGKHESGWNAKNVYGSWDDVGKPSGGALSWRAERLDAMREFAKNNGGDPNKPSPELQAKFLLQENPGLIEALNNAKTPEEAQRLMNNAWKFKGYDQPGGEAERRIQTAIRFAGQFGKEGVDPWAGMRDGVAAAAPEAATPQGRAKSLVDTLASLGSALETPSGGQQDLNLPQAPSPIGPRPGNYSPNADVMRTILAMLAPGAQQIPSLGMLLQGRGIGG